MSKFSIFRSINRLVILPTTGFTLGYVSFMKTWPSEAGSMSLKDKLTGPGDNRLHLQRLDIISKIQNDRFYKNFEEDTSVIYRRQSETLPKDHLPYHVGQGVLFGPGKLEIDPIIFHDEADKSIVVFYHLGEGLGNENGNVHKGILSLLMDEALCYCGFPTLPNGRGVTAKLSLKFLNDLPVNSTIVLRANVRETKGRKCIIDGTVESMPTKDWLRYLVGQEKFKKGKIYALSLIHI